ncbi:MAG: integrase family protein [Frankiales bacterium]|nr:integrase family protein [Frankiales bacterium]
MKGSVYKRCACEVQRNARGDRLACKKDHGSWYYVADVPGLNGKRRQVKKGGYPTKTAAEQALTAVIDEANRGQVAHDDGQRVGDYLDAWLAGKIADGLRTNTAVGYRHHIDDFLRPHLGHLRLRDLKPSHVEHVLRVIAAPPAKGRPLGPSTVRRVHATLRSALASAKRRRLINYNPAVDIDLPKVSRPKVRPWEAAELGAFLDSLRGHRLAPLFETIAATGLRRGEALGLRWDDVDLERMVIVVRQQLLQVADTAGVKPCPYCDVAHRQYAFGPPKTSSGEARIVELDSGTAGVLLEHSLRQAAERDAWGEAYSDHGVVFAREDGQPIPPDTVSKAFVGLSKAAGLRPVRLHDLRHGAASLRLAAGVDIAVVSKQLGHSTIALTVDTYSHMLDGVGRQAAEKAMALVPRAPRDQSVTSPARGSSPREAADPLTCGDAAPPSGLEPETLRLTVACSAN